MFSIRYIIHRSIFSRTNNFFPEEGQRSPRSAWDVFTIWCRFTATHRAPEPIVMDTSNTMSITPFHKSPIWARLISVLRFITLRSCKGYYIFVSGIFLLFDVRWWPLLRTIMVMNMIPVSIELRLVFDCVTLSCLQWQNGWPWTYKVTIGDHQR